MRSTFHTPLKIQLQKNEIYVLQVRQPVCSHKENSWRNLAGEEDLWPKLKSDVFIGYFLATLLEHLEMT